MDFDEFKEKYHKFASELHQKELELGYVFDRNELFVSDFDENDDVEKENKKRKRETAREARCSKIKFLFWQITIGFLFTIFLHSPLPLFIVIFGFIPGLI